MLDDLKTKEHDYKSNLWSQSEQKSGSNKHEKDKINQFMAGLLKKIGKDTTEIKERLAF